MEMQEVPTTTLNVDSESFETKEQNTIDNGSQQEESNQLSPEDLIKEHIESAQKQITQDEDGASEGEEKKEVSKAEGKEEPNAGEGEGKKGAQEPASSEEAQASGESGESKEEGRELSGESEQSESLDFTYTFRGKKHELPEELKGVIKDEETLEKYRDVFTKAEGLPLIKEKGMQAQNELNQLHQNLNNFYQQVQVKDFGKAFELAEIPKPTLSELQQGFGISDRDLIEHAYKLAKMTPEQQQMMRQQSEADRRVQELEMKVQNQEQQQQVQLQNYIKAEFDELHQDERLGEIARKFDETHGEGAFDNEIVQRGFAHQQQTGQIKGPKALANEIITRYNLGSLISQSPSDSQADITSQPARNKKSTQKKEVPVIPAVENSGSGSPGQRTISSLEDIEKIYQEKFGSA